MLSSQEYMQLLSFLNRVDLKGNEAPTLVVLVQKLQQAARAAKEIEGLEEDKASGSSKKEKADA